jgi:hypothetical protein
MFHKIIFGVFVNHGQILRDPEVPFLLSPSILQFIFSYMRNQHFSVARLLQAYQVIKAKAIYYGL